MRKKNIIMIFFMILISIIGILLYCLFKKNDSNYVSKENTNIEFNEQEKHIIDLVYKRLNILDYFDQNNLEYFDIKSIWVLGYFESSSNIFHLQVNYDYKCKDGTQNCDNTDENAKYDEYIHAFRVKVDLNDSDYIEKVDKFATTINSDWIGYDEEDPNIVNFYDMYNVKE